MLRVVVIGLQGQLARALAELSGGDIAVSCIGRPRLDLAESKTVATALADLPADIVVNTAAYTAVDKAESEADLAFRINRDGAAAVAEACARRDLPLIHLSTDYVFSGDQPEPWHETDPCQPQSVYGASKLAGEQAVQAALPSAVILRTAWLHSPFGANFIKTMLRLSRERDRLRVVADQHGSPTYAADLAVAILVMAKQVCAGGPGGIFHLAGAGSATWHEVAVETMRAAGRTIPVDPISTVEYPTLAKRPANSVLETAKIAADYGLRLPPWQDGVQRCVARLLG
jgi:dTDP-4-dehydrorhamnose reductase